MIVMHSSSGRPAQPVSASPSRRALLLAGSVGALGATLTACGGGVGGSGKPTVIVGCYGVEYMARLVAGDAARVVNLAKPGQEPHDIELSVAETATVQKADVIVQIPGFQSALDDVISSKKLKDAVLDVSKVVDLLPSSGEEEHDETAGSSDASDGGDEHDAHGSFDPHFWNDPTLLAKVATALGDRLANADPKAASTFRSRARTAVKTLTDLDAELSATYGGVQGEKVFVTGHTAFAYLARRYGLEQVGITGIDPEVEPSPQRLLELQRVIQQRHVTTVFFEENASPKVAETLAKNVGVSSQSLDNLETRTDPKKDYVAVMREDAAKLVATWS